MRRATPSFFEGIPHAELEPLFERLERRRYPAGSVVIAEGETCREIYVTQSGAADVFVADRSGEEHVVGHVGPGATLGEMSLFTGQPAVGTVRAAGDLELLVLSEADFERLSRSFPQVYRNLGAILSERLALTDRLTLREEPGRLVVLDDAGAPPLLAYALACSVAWHSRESTLLVLVDDDPPDVLKTISDGAAGEVELSQMRPPTVAERGGAQMIVVSSDGSFAPEALAQATEELCKRYEHVLIAVSGSAPVGLSAFRTVRLTGPESVDRGGTTPAYRIQAWSATNGRVGPDSAGLIRVPPLEAADEAELAHGRLPISTPAGNALGWVARDLTGLKVGVALGAGSVRGFAHWGALRALKEAGLPIDYLAGTSIGATAAAIHAAGFSIQDGIDIFKKGATAAFRPTVPIRSLLSSRAAAKVIRHYSGDRRIEDLEIPLAIVAADILTQREVVFRRGLLWKALLATVSIPGVLPVQRVGPYTLVDGGILNPVPTGTVSDMGAGVAIGVKLVRRARESDLDAEAVAETTAPSVTALGAILRAVEIMQTNIAPAATDAASILITPEFQNLPSGKLRRFSAGLRYVDAGAEAVEAARPRMAAALPWLRS
jgi:NTE family protein